MAAVAIAASSAALAARSDAKRVAVAAAAASLRRSIGSSSSSSTAGGASAAAGRFVAPAAKGQQRGQQQRHLLNTTTVPTGSPASTPFPPSMLHAEVPLPRPAVTLEQPKHLVLAGSVLNEGRQVELAFADGSKFELHSSWLKDASPTNRGPDFYRTSAADVWKLKDFVIREVKPLSEGGQIQVSYGLASAPEVEQHVDIFESKWLHAFAPFVGKDLVGTAKAPEPVKGTGSLMRTLYQNRKPWRSDVEISKFDAQELVQNPDLQVEFLERMIDPGLAMITGVGRPEALEREFAGKPIEDLIFKVIGKFNQHPVRSTTYGVMRKTAESAKQGADYDMSNPLSMHTDHSVYHGTPGFLQFLYQAEGSVRSKVCDGFALAEYVRENHPRAYELLTTVEMTHSSRNTLYTREGAPRSVYDKESAPVPFELVHTHPIICLDPEGQIEKVVQSETKRGVCALPYDIYEEFMEAYELWTQLCEDARFIKHFDWPEGTAIVTNNWRTMHGRASVPPGMARTMAFGYVNKILVENRYRLLRQLQSERKNPAMDDRWLTRVPNQVLERLVE